MGSLQLAKNTNKFMGRVKSLDVRCNDALLMVRHFLANQLTYVYASYIYIYQSQLSVSSANAVLQTKKQNWKVFLGSWSLVPQENQFQEVSMIVIEYKVLKSENPRPMIQINFPEFNFPGWITNIRLTDPNHGLRKITKTVFLQGARESVAKSGETILTSV